MSQMCVIVRVCKMGGMIKNASGHVGNCAWGNRSGHLQVNPRLSPRKRGIHAKEWDIDKDDDMFFHLLDSWL